MPYGEFESLALAAFGLGVPLAIGLSFLPIAIRLRGAGIWLWLRLACAAGLTAICSFPVATWMLRRCPPIDPDGVPRPYAGHGMAITLGGLIGSVLTGAMCLAALITALIAWHPARARATPAPHVRHRWLRLAGSLWPLPLATAALLLAYQVTDAAQM